MYEISFGVRTIKEVLHYRINSNGLNCILKFDILRNTFHQKEIKGLAKVEQVLLDTADSVMDTKRKIEFGVQQIVFKVSIDFYQ